MTNEQAERLIEAVKAVHGELSSLTWVLTAALAAAGVALIFGG